jgi:hypothetical protein
MKETLEEVAEKYLQEWRLLNNIHLSNVIHAERCKNDFIAGAKWQQEQHNFLPGFIKQFDPKQGEINGEEWTAVHFLKWMKLNNFKIIKNETRNT